MTTLRFSPSLSSSTEVKVNFNFAFSHFRSHCGCRGCPDTPKIEVGVSDAPRFLSILWLVDGFYGVLRSFYCFWKLATSELRWNP